MIAWTCDRVAEELDLYAAGESAAAEQAAVETHLKSCGACQANLASSRRLLHLLDLRAAEPVRLTRLQALIRQEARQRRRSPVLTLVRRYAALAALLMIGVGLAVLPTPSVPLLPTPMLGNVLVVASLTGPAALEPVPAGPGHAELHGVHDPAAMKIARTTEAREPLATYALKTDGLAAPVGLRLTLENKGPDPLTVRPGGPRTEVRLKLKGPGVKSTPMNPTVNLALAPPILTLQPGQSEVLTLERLTAGRNGAVEALTWTLPGEYELTGTLHLEAGVRGQPTGVCEVVLPLVRLRIR
jgi:hypothetical protein